MANSSSCLVSCRLTRAIDREERRDQRRRGVGGQRPEHPRHFDALVVADDQREPEDGGQRQQDAGARRSRPAATRRRPAARARRRARGRRGRSLARVQCRSCECTLSARSAAASTSCRPQRGQAAEIARRAHPLIAGTARQARHFDRLGERRPGSARAPSAPAASGRRSRRPAWRSSRRCAAGRCRRRRTAGCGRSAREARQVELAEIDDARARRSPQPVARAGRDPLGGRAIRRPGAQHDAGVSATPAPGRRPASANAGSGQRRNGLLALTCTTISSCRGSTPARCSRSAIRRSAAGSSGISTASRAGSGGAAGPAVDRAQQVPLIQHRVPRPQLPRARRRCACTSTAGPAMS